MNYEFGNGMVSGVLALILFFNGHHLPAYPCEPASTATLRGAENGEAIDTPNIIQHRV
ncbi:MAG: hypothetical protein ACM30E_10665 [Nitrososphaerales archaeon]